MRPQAKLHSVIVIL